MAGPVDHHARTNLFEHDGELGFRLAPFARHFPFRRRLTQDQIDEFCRGLVIGEVAADFDRPPELCVQSLNGVRRVDDPAYRRPRVAERSLPSAHD